MEVEIENEEVVENTSTENSDTGTEVTESTPAPEPKESVKELSLSEKIRAAGEKNQAKTGSVPDGKPAVYAPNYKFTVDKIEKEIPEWARGAIKDAESEKMVRDIFEKAEGLEVAKPRHLKREEELQTEKKAHSDLTQKHSALTKSLDDLSTFLQNEDYDSFFETIKVPQDKILQYALSLIERAKWTPDRVQEFQNSRQQTQRLRLLEKQNSDLSSQSNQAAYHARQSAVQSVLARPDITTHVTAFDSRFGEGSFLKEVWQRGLAAYHMTGQDLSPEMAVQETLKLIGVDLSKPAQPTQQTATQTVPVKIPPVIPNVQGRTTSPTKNKVRSIADIRKISAQMAGK